MHWIFLTKDIKLTKQKFKFGDHYPIEKTWRRSVHYPFALLKSYILHQPCKAIGIGLDTSRVSRNASGQIVYNEQCTRKSVLLCYYDVSRDRREPRVLFSIRLLCSSRMASTQARAAICNRSTVNRRGPLWVAVHVVERSVNYGSPPQHDLRWKLASCNSYACRPASFCRRLLRVSRAPRACCRQLSIHFPEDRARCREPAPSVNERSFPARPGTGSTETTQGMGRAAAKMYTVTGTSIPAELLRPTSAIHHFPTHAARTGAVERSDERLNKL